jgi:hypothetical protein
VISFVENLTLREIHGGNRLTKLTPCPESRKGEQHQHTRKQDAEAAPAAMLRTNEPQNLSPDQMRNEHPLAESASN